MQPALLTMVDLACLKDWGEVEKYATNQIPIQRGWTVANSRAGLRFFQFGEGSDIKTTSWSVPLGGLFTSLAAPTTPPEPVDLEGPAPMTPPPCSGERRVSSPAAKEPPSPPPRPPRTDRARAPTMVDPHMLLGLPAGPRKPRPALLRVPAAFPHVSSLGQRHPDSGSRRCQQRYQRENGTKAPSR
ncbi:kptA [Symbiodinium natans]|uniref:KptA protein n=1 Tax=Symbiodinium natans TaxID=878477 RepID=A0A812MC45_9DINO|nr:kptA [Symbiodinium natans]